MYSELFEAVSTPVVQDMQALEAAPMLQLRKG